LFHTDQSSHPSSVFRFAPGIHLFIHSVSRKPLHNVICLGIMVATFIAVCLFVVNVVCSAEGARVDGRSRSARVRSLIPWTEYRFGVVAINSAGEGGMASVTEGGVCRTPPAVPERSPRSVCTDSRRPHQLVVVWEVCTLAWTSHANYRSYSHYRRHL